MLYLNRLDFIDFISRLSVFGPYWI